MARGAANQAMNIRARRRGLVRCPAGCMVVRFGACLLCASRALSLWLVKPGQERVKAGPLALTRFSVARWDDRVSRPYWLRQALESYDSARRSLHAASVKKEFENSLKKLSELGVKRRNLPQWDQYMVAKPYLSSLVRFSRILAVEARLLAACVRVDSLDACQAALGAYTYIEEVGSLIRRTASFREIDVDLQVRSVGRSDSFTDSDKLRLMRSLENSSCVEGNVTNGSKAIKFKLKCGISVDLVLWTPQNEDFPNLRGGKDAEKNFKRIHAFLKKTPAARNAIIAIKTLFPEFRPKGLLLDAIAWRLWKNYAFHDPAEDWFMFLIYVVDALQNWERSPFGSDLEQDLRMLPAEKRKEHIQSFARFQNMTFMDWAVLIFAPLDRRSAPDDINDCENVLQMVDHVSCPLHIRGRFLVPEGLPFASGPGKPQCRTHIRFFFPSCSSWRCFLDPARLRMIGPFTGPMHPDLWIRFHQQTLNWLAPRQWEREVESGKR